MAQTAYNLHDLGLGDKFIKSVDAYIVDQLDYNYNLLKDNSGNLDLRTVQYVSHLLMPCSITAITPNSVK